MIIILVLNLSSPDAVSGAQIVHRSVTGGVTVSVVLLLPLLYNFYYYCYDYYKILYILCAFQLHILVDISLHLSAQTKIAIIGPSQPTRTWTRGRVLQCTRTEWNCKKLLHCKRRGVNCQLSVNTNYLQFRKLPKLPNNSRKTKNQSWVSLLKPSYFAVLNFLGFL